MSSCCTCSYYDSRLRLSDARPPVVRIKDAKINFESFSEPEYDFPEDPMQVSWQDGDQLHGGASEHDSRVATTGASVPESVQVPNREKCTFLQRRKCTAICGTTHVSCMPTFII